MRINSGVLATFIFASAWTGAHAETGTINIITDPNVTVHTSYGSGVHNVQAGAFGVTFTPTGGSPGQEFNAYCVDLFNGASSGMVSVTNTGNLATLTDVVPNSGSLVAYLYNNFEKNTTDSAALQVAIWDAEYNYNASDSVHYGLTLVNTAVNPAPSNFAVDALSPAQLTVFNDAQTYLNDVETAITDAGGSSHVSTLGSTTLYKPTSGGQGLIGPTPEPGASTLLLSGLLGGVGFVTRRRRVSRSKS